MAVTAPGQELQAGALGQAICEGLGIVDPDGRAVTTGTTGEIVTRGSNVFPGYLGDPDANAAALLPQGWFHTRDVGRIDEIATSSSMAASKS